MTMCECGHDERYHPMDLIRGDDGFEDEARPCRVPGCRCRDFEPRETAIAWSKNRQAVQSKSDPLVWYRGNYWSQFRTAEEITDEIAQDEKEEDD